MPTSSGTSQLRPKRCRSIVMRRLWQRLQRFLFAGRIPRILHGIIGCVCCPHPLNRLADVDFGTVCSCTYRRADDFWLCKSLSLGAPVPFQYMVDLAIVADVLHGCVADLACNYIRSSWQSGVAFLGSRLGVVFSLSVAGLSSEYRLGSPKLVSKSCG